MIAPRARIDWSVQPKIFLSFGTVGRVSVSPRRVVHAILRRASLHAVPSPAPSRSRDRNRRRCQRAVEMHCQTTDQFALEIDFTRESMAPGDGG